jgi:hypothetical protein
VQHSYTELMVDGRHTHDLSGSPSAAAAAGPSKLGGRRHRARQRATAFSFFFVVLFLSSMVAITL